MHLRTHTRTLLLIHLPYLDTGSIVLKKGLLKESYNNKKKKNRKSFFNFHLVLLEFLLYKFLLNACILYRDAYRKKIIFLRYAIIKVILLNRCTYFLISLSKKNFSMPLNFILSYFHHIYFA